MFRIISLEQIMKPNKKKQIKRFTFAIPFEELLDGNSDKKRFLRALSKKFALFLKS